MLLIWIPRWNSFKSMRAHFNNIPGVAEIVLIAP